MTNQNKQNRLIDNVLMISHAYLMSLSPALAMCDRLIDSNPPPYSRVRKLIKALSTYQSLSMSNNIDQDYTTHLIRVINWGWKYRHQNDNQPDTDLIHDLGSGLAIADGVVNFIVNLQQDVQDGCLSEIDSCNIINCLNQAKAEYEQIDDYKAKRTL